MVATAAITSWGILNIRYIISCNQAIENIASLEGEPVSAVLERATAVAVIVIDPLLPPQDAFVATAVTAGPVVLLTGAVLVHPFASSTVIV